MKSELQTLHDALEKVLVSDLTKFLRR